MSDIQIPPVPSSPAALPRCHGLLSLQTPSPTRPHDAQPPNKRPKTDHTSPTPDLPRPRSPAAAFSSAADHSSRPLTSCASIVLGGHRLPVSVLLAANNRTAMGFPLRIVHSTRDPPHASPAACFMHTKPLSYEFMYRNFGLIIPYPYQVAGLAPQSILSSPPSRTHSLVPHVTDRVQTFDRAITRPRQDATRRDVYISSQHSLASASNPSSLVMHFDFGAQMTTQLPFFDSYPVSSNKSDVRTHPQAPGCDPGIPDPMSSSMYDGAEFAQDVLSCPLFAESLSSMWDFHPASFQQSMPSPSSRSMSRSSFASSFFTDPSSPYPEDYPTPSSDSVSTPAPSEAFPGFFPDCPQDVFASDLSIGLDAKTRGEHDLSYVLGSAPLSPNGTFTFDFPSLPQPAASTSARFAEARRHSEPANVAALQFAPFLAQVPPPAPLPEDFMAMTLPITDNLASTSGSGTHSALPSSIAPHQTELPRPLELKHPKPVRGYKPPILLSGYHYDPKDFVRRRSEPILPLPDLDVASHLSLDVPLESDEDDSMEYEDGAYEDVPEDEECDEDYDPTLFEDMDLESWLGVTQAGILDPSWSWPPQTNVDPRSLPTLPSGDVLGFDWASLPPVA
ncbi:hypothetical protein C8Q80DRAFT_39186 [Daedaleopsis nitida]|nr:hypothetical protein C8Q80DRAFT_39186 [Daedaleopsis nitida]